MAFQALTEGPGSTSGGVWKAGIGSMILIAGGEDKGSSPNLGDGVFFSGAGDPVINSSGNVAFLGILTGTGVTTWNNQGIWTDAGGTLTMIARTGPSGPGPNLGVGVDFRTLEFPVISSSGNVAFLGSVIGGDYDQNNSEGVWTNVGGQISRIARQGTEEQGPNLGAGVTYSRFEEVVLNAAGDAAFVARL